MHGFVSTRPVGREGNPRDRICTDFELAAAWGRAAGQLLSFELTIRTDNLHRLSSDPAHPAAISGSVTCPALSAQPMRVLRGDFHLLPIDPEHVETWRMTYDMVLERDGGPVHFNGFKVLHQGAGSHWWDDLTTLFVTVRQGADGEGGLLAQGTLRLDLEDLMWQGASVKVDCAHGLIADLVNHIPAARVGIEMIYGGRFAGFFGGVLFQAYGGVLADMNNFPAQPGVRPPVRPLNAPLPSVHPIALADGFRIRLTRYRGGAKGPVILAPGFTVKASSFAIDTVEQNLAEYLTFHGYDVWLFDYRASQDSGSPIKKFTIDDIANVDWPAAVKYVCGETGAADVQVLAHCVGSMSLLMALLKGMKGVRSVISSALTLHPVTNWLSYLKVDLDVVRLLEKISELKCGFNIVPGDTEFEHEIDFIAWNVPVPEGEECKNPVCHRIFTIFGPSYAHSQLNHATHTAMMDMFGRIAIPPFEQLALIMQREKAVDHLGHDCYLKPALASNLALPISFITGSMNQEFDPETITRTHRWLVEHNGAAYYDRHVFEGYAHMDLFIGRQAANDVYPYLLEQLDRYN
jgi:cholesterol oxidase